MLTFGRTCPQCYSREIFKSHFGAWDFFLLLFLLRPVRCGDCFTRYHRPVFFMSLSREPHLRDEAHAGKRLSA
jgi:hypothetical protein